MPTTTSEKKTSKPAPKKAEASVKPAPKTDSQKSSGAFAVIETGGKQYGVKVGEAIKIEKLGEGYKVGDAVNFDKVLISGEEFGAPYIAGAKVSGSIVEIGRNPKVIVIKYKQKSRYFKKNGHRQPYFKVKIEKIG